MSKPNADLCYPVLMPFKFRGVVIKPPAHVQMSADEAQVYQAAGVLGGEDVAALPPESETDGDDAEHDTTAAEAEASAAEQQAVDVEASESKKPAAKAKKAAAKKAAR